MILIDDIEFTRLELQNRLDAAKTQDERNRLGQFATPTALAADILEYARALLPSHAQIRFLDPAIGTGSFYSALLHTFPPTQIAEATGYEVDPHYGYKALELWGSTPLRLHIGDFTRAVSPDSNDVKANLLICNPPYVRHHHLSSNEKLRLQQVTERMAGIRLNGLAGLYCYFLCISHGWMAENGLAGWLIPSEFMDVNYGEQVKKYLLDRVTLLRIHRFDPDDVQFGDALVSSAVVWLKKAPPPPDHIVEFTYGGTLTKPNFSGLISVDTLRGAPKWTRFPLSSSSVQSDYKQLKLSDLFKIQRGLVTGANEFFILTPDRIAMYQIPAEFLTPILPSPRYLSADEIEADDVSEPILKRKLFLLRCDLPEDLVQARYPSLWKYLQTGVAAGIDQRYLCRHRSPWYVQETRPPAALLCTYMGRQGDRNRPFRFILNHSKATAANVYLMLYPQPLVQRELTNRPDLLKALCDALNSIAPETLVCEGRVYGGGLHKLEPKELGNVSAEPILTVLPGLSAGRARQLSLFDDVL